MKLSYLKLLDNMQFQKFSLLGVISWAEYHKYFLLKNGIPEDYVDNHNEKHEELQRSVKGISLMWSC